MNDPRYKRDCPPVQSSINDLPSEPRNERVLPQFRYSFGKDEAFAYAEHICCMSSIGTRLPQPIRPSMGDYLLTVRCYPSYGQNPTNCM